MARGRCPGPGSQAGALCLWGVGETGNPVWRKEVENFAWEQGKAGKGLGRGDEGYMRSSGGYNCCARKITVLQ